MKKYIVVMVVLALLAGAGGFFGGMTYQKSQASTGFAQGGRNFAGGPMGQGRNFTGAPGGPMGQGQNAAGRPVAGDVVEIDGTSMTVKLQDGSTKIVMMSSSTTVNKATTVSRDQLKKGEHVMVMGTANSDGSVTADSINVGQFGFSRPPQQQNQQNQ